MKLIKFNKIQLYAKNLFESKYQLVINGGEKDGIRTLSLNPKALIDQSLTIDDVYENLDYNTSKKKKMLIVFDDTIAEMESYSYYSSIVTELF